MSFRSVVSRFNIFTRRTLGSLGPVSPGRLAATGVATYSTLQFGVPKVLTWMGREVWAPSATALWGTVAVTALFVEGVCYVFGQDPDVHAEATVSAMRDLAASYLSSAERERALVRQSGMDQDAVHAMLLAMSNAQTPPAAPAAEERQAAQG